MRNLSQQKNDLRRVNMNAIEYVKLKEFRDTRTAEIKNGVLYVHHEGKLIPAKEFDKMFPLPERLYICITNPDAKNKLNF